MRAKSLQSCPTLCDPMDCTGSSVHGDSAGKNTSLPCPLPGDLPNPGIKPRSPALQADSLPSEPLGKPKNTGVGSLSLLQWIFPTQELNQGLLHCRWILYQLNYQGSLHFLGLGSILGWELRSCKPRDMVKNPQNPQNCLLCLSLVN